MTAVKLLQEKGNEMEWYLFTR